MVRTWARKSPVINSELQAAHYVPGTAYHMRCFIEYKNNHAM
jgi:hypothetical protein